MAFCPVAFCPWHFVRWHFVRTPIVSSLHPSLNSAPELMHSTSVNTCFYILYLTLLNLCLLPHIDKDDAIPRLETIMHIMQSFSYLTGPFTASFHWILSYSLGIGSCLSSKFKFSLQLFSCDKQSSRQWGCRRWELSQHSCLAMNS